jgi:RHS repeat-associated protein
VKIGYDVNGDDDIDDPTDDLVWNQTFGGTTTAVSHDHAGNLIDDGTFVYVYDGWNRLMKVRASGDPDVTIQTCEFDASGRRIKKVVNNSGIYDKTEVYLYDGQRIIETRLGGQTTMNQQFIHGPQYIDELVMMRSREKGDLYVQQDANWNVIGLTDQGRHVVERSVYTPYGELTIHQDTSYGDRDGDQDVDSTDKGTVGTTCPGTVSGSCRILDLDFDGDYDSADAGFFDSLPQGLARHPGRSSTGVSQPFAHQGLLFEPELASYQNRARQYDPSKRRFAQRDPLALDGDGGSGYQDGMNVYQFATGNPLNNGDPAGTNNVSFSISPTEITVHIGIAFWGVGRDKSHYAASELERLWNGNKGESYVCGIGGGVKRVTFSFRFVTLDLGSMCNNLPPPERRDDNDLDDNYIKYGSACADLALRRPATRAIDATAVMWIRGNLTGRGRKFGGAQLGGAKAFVWRSSLNLPRGVVAHEIGHLMHLTSDDCPGRDHIMVETLERPRPVICCNRYDVLFRNGIDEEYACCQPGRR